MLRFLQPVPLFLSLFVAAFPELGQAAEPDSAGIDFFEKKIRPVLAQHCYECHSNRAKKLQGGLKLDSRSTIRRGGESGPSVVPGKVEDSLLIAALRHEGLEMPPGQRLPQQVVDDFVRWVEAGAPDPRDTAETKQGENPNAELAKTHWAFQPVQRPEPPAVQNADRLLSHVDQFVLARLAEQGLQLAPPADKVTLVRRAYFDLIGLPPTPEEVAEFVNDDSPDAFAALVDRLLDSPGYGERWGRYWLDVARYADNKGYVLFEEKTYPWAYTYRDWVIRALNEDLPYDQFVMQQLAADQLQGDSPDRLSLAAMGFVTLGGKFNNSTHDILDDRIDVITRGLLGLTVTCARCHDHKFDPTTQADYYALYGVLRSSIEPALPPEFQTPPDTDEYQTFAAGMQERMAKFEAFVTQQRDLVSRGSRERAAEYLLAVHTKRNQPDTENFMLLTDKGALNPSMIHRWEMYLKRVRRQADPVWTAWQAYFDLPNAGFAAAATDVHRRLIAADGEFKVNSLVRSAFEKAGPPSKFVEVAETYGKLLREVDASWEKLRADEPAATRLPDDAAEAVRQALYGSGAPPALPEELTFGFLTLLPDRPTQAEYKKLLKEIETWSMKQPGAPARAMVLCDSQTPYQPVVFERGNPYREGEPVARRYPAFLDGGKPGRFTHGSGRLELAERIADSANPLTARVFVNRVWRGHFNKGLVGTPSDFGLRSDKPSHPELLDWLAATFVEQGWSIKQLHRTIMNSAVYRQSGSASTGNQTNPAQVDPENRLLWHFPQRRLDYEATRDALLAVSGSLDRTMGGPPVNVLSGFKPRRTVYGFVDRMDLPGLMRAFDFPEPAATSPGREQTTVAPQALFFMNNAFTLECARRLLARADVKSIAEPKDRVARIYQVLFAREPDQDETALALDYLTSEQRWEEYVHALLMTNEFVFVD